MCLWKDRKLQWMKRLGKLLLPAMGISTNLEVLKIYIADIILHIKLKWLVSTTFVGYFAGTMKRVTWVELMVYYANE